MRSNRRVAPTRLRLSVLPPSPRVHGTAGDATGAHSALRRGLDTCHAMSERVSDRHDRVSSPQPTARFGVYRHVAPRRFVTD